MTWLIFSAAALVGFLVGWALHARFHSWHIVDFEHLRAENRVLKLVRDQWRERAATLQRYVDKLTGAA